MKPIGLVGSEGKMSKVLQEILGSQKRSFKLWSSKADPQLRTENFEDCSGIIDFSLPEVSAKVLELAETARLPYVCGTTGWSDFTATRKAFLKAADHIPIVLDSNFSAGIEILCQVAELIGQNLKTPIVITDIHHTEKRDAPSGTALKIADRIQGQSSIQSIRLGNIFGEHRLLISFQDQTMEFIHRAHSRRPFAEGALQALKWAHDKKPGLYSMKDVLS